MMKTVENTRWVIYDPKGDKFVGVRYGWTDEVDHIRFFRTAGHAKASITHNKPRASHLRLENDYYRKLHDLWSRVQVLPARCVISVDVIAG